MAGLLRPDGLGDDEWDAIKEADERLLKAKAAGDAALVVGGAKELCESIAKVVLAERGGIPDRGEDLPALITAAHRLLEFQPGEGVAQDPGTRKLAQGLKSIVLGIGEVRNRFGTGHGRAAPSGITDEHGALAFEASYLWSSWALKRLEPYIAGDVTRLVRDLEGMTFHGGDLARRLEYANLPRLPEEEQRRLGVAVARRASRGTFVVSRDGIQAMRAEDPERWPAGYVEGVLTGRLFDANGILQLGEARIQECARLLGALADPESAAQRLASRAVDAISARAFVSGDAGSLGAAQEVRDAAARVPTGEARQSWLEIARALEKVDQDGQ